MKDKLRLPIVWMLLCSMLLWGMSGIAVSATDSDVTSQTEAQIEEVVACINAFRQENGLEPLQIAPVLLEIGAMRAEELKQSYGHTRPDGTSWFTAIENAEVDSNCYAAENIAAGYATPQEVFTAWKNSDAHREAMLGEHYQYIGIGISYLENDPNYYFYYWEMVLISSEIPLEGSYYPFAEKTDTGTQTTPAVEHNLIYGDINGDLQVTLEDAVKLQQIQLGLIPETGGSRLQMDCCQDGVIDGRDVLALLRYCVDSRNALPVVP